MAKKQHVAVYLDTDANGDDLLDSVGNNITAGWYLYAWPLQPEPEGPFENELAAILSIDPDPDYDDQDNLKPGVDHR